MNAEATQLEEKEKKIRNMIRRRITGIIMGLAMIALWIIQGWPLRIGFALMMLISIWEMYDAFVTKGARPIRWIGVAYALLVVPAYMYYGMAAQMPLMSVCCMLGLAGVILRGEIDFESAVATLFPLFYPGALITLLFPLLDIEPGMVRTVALALLFLVSPMSDLWSYEIGTLYGKHPMSPQLSPKKSWEGSIAGLVGSTAFAMLVPVVGNLLVTYVPLFQPYAAALPPLWMFALIGLVGGVAAQIGDLTASMVKRYCGIKDFGAIFPGHGGMLDRMDSMVFSGAVIYIFFVVIWRA